MNLYPLIYSVVNVYLYLMICTMHVFIHKLRVSCLFQLDMELEAHNLRRFQQNMGDNYCVKFPTPLFPFVTKRVLVETFEVV